MKGINCCIKYSTRVYLNQINTAKQEKFCGAKLQGLIYGSQLQHEEQLINGIAILDQDSGAIFASVLRQESIVYEKTKNLAIVICAMLLTR